jgi:hypothetical protein
MLHIRGIFFSICLLSCATFFHALPPAHGDIYEWEWIDPTHPELGKQQSATVCPGGAGVDAVPSAYLSYRDLTQAYLISVNLTSVFASIPD